MTPLNRVTIALALVLPWSLLQAQAASPLSKRLQRITDRPALAHATFGMEVLAIDTGKVLLAINADKLFTPGSTTKLLTEGAALELLGPDHRFVTRLYRTGPIGADGTLDGNLVWVASGDPNISGRIRPDGTLAYENFDHSYAGVVPAARVVAGDPLAVVRDLARQVVAKGVKRIRGNVLVDVGLFPEGEAEAGTGAVISPVVVNDNIVDVTLESGGAAGAPAVLKASPASRYVRFTNQVTTGASDSKSDIGFTADVAGDDGIRTVTVAGSVPAGADAKLLAYKVPQPSRFAQDVLASALEELGVSIDAASVPATPDAYTADRAVAEHRSLPLAEEIKVTLKVSQNLHASMTPYIVGATLRPKSEDLYQAGFDVEREFLVKAGLDLSSASQADGAGGPGAAFTPDFMCRYLAFMARSRSSTVFAQALPVLGRDGTLSTEMKDSPAAGHVAAKTGTARLYDALNRSSLLAGKGLAGYITTRSGKKLAFAAFINNAPIGSDIAAAQAVGGALAEAAEAVFEEVP
ncbi:MAG TPA: D-alanyl-D-alanine carboxypeptidase/D-alanyl-D-alanine-endopeptidase [Candidatus Polarisedimenticolaceae bacterium]|nr:D-alanyl-D-alanine carboxypeptidase/D-alanyl-D-alanine-endopeptidase [Candidatus Polarisedimenticolaceae bacterium]